MSRHKRETRKKRVAEIVEFENTEVYKLLQKEALLKGESATLIDKDLAKLQEKTYQSPGINKQAAVIWKNITSTTVHLNEQLKAIDDRIAELNSDSREITIKTRIELLGKRKSLLNNAIGQLKTDHANLSALENELYPVLRAEQGKVFLQNKNTAAELYVNLKQHVTAIRFELAKYDTVLQEAIKPDIEQLDKLLAEIDIITNKIIEIHEKSKGGMISSGLFAEMANQLHELTEKKFDIEQRCKLIEDRLAIAKQDQAIAEQTVEFKQVYNNLSPLFGIVYMAATQGYSRYSDLSKELKALIIADDSRSKLSFSAANYQPQIPLSSMNWNDDATGRVAIKQEREHLIEQLNDKRNLIDQITRTIITNQHALKTTISEDLEFCSKRAELYDSLTNNPRDSARGYARVTNALQFDFLNGMSTPKYQAALNDLLHYGFESDSPESSVLVRNLKSTRKELEQFHSKFEKNYPALTLKDSTFIFNGISYPRSDSISKTLEDYLLAHARISEALEKGDRQVSYADAIDYKKELEKLKEGKANIEQFITNYQVEQRKITGDIKELQRRFQNLSTIRIINDSLPHKGKSYILESSIIAQVKEYNSIRDSLTQDFEKNPFPDSKTLAALKEQVTTLEKHSTNINKFLEEQRKLQELNVLRNQLGKQQLLIMKKVDVIDKIIKKIAEEIKDIQSSSSDEDPKLNILVELQRAFSTHYDRLGALSESIDKTKGESKVTNLDTTQAAVESISKNNKVGTESLVHDLTDVFDKHLPKLSADSFLNQFMEWIDENIIEPIYTTFVDTEKTYKPGCFASTTAKHLDSFRKEILPELEEIQSIHAPPAA